MLPLYLLQVSSQVTPRLLCLCERGNTGKLDLEKKLRLWVRHVCFMLSHICDATLVLAAGVKPGHPTTFVPLWAWQQRETRFWEETEAWAGPARELTPPPPSAVPAEWLSMYNADRIRPRRPPWPCLRCCPALGVNSGWKISYFVSHLLVLPLCIYLSVINTSKVCTNYCTANTLQIFGP